MKKLLPLMTGLLLAGGTAQAQVALEHRYAGTAFQFKMNTNEVKYAVTDRASQTVSIYNQDHSLYGHLTVPAGPTGTTFTGISYLSDKLFNQDAPLEYLAFYLTRLPSGSFYHTGRLYTESGLQLAQIDSIDAASLAVYNTATGTKMRFFRFSAADLQGGTSATGTNIYALGGTLVMKTTAPSGTTELSAFPNPANTEITLPYHLPSGHSTGKLEVINMLGQVVKSYTVGSQFNDILLDTALLAPATYAYRVTAGGTVTTGKKFVVSR